MEMKAEEEQDLFASIIKFCKQIEEEEQEPTASLSNCPLARESDKFLDSNNEQFSSEAKIVKVERKDSQSGAHSGKIELAGKSWFSRLHEAKDSHRNGGVRLLLSRKRNEEIDEFRFVDDGKWEGREEKVKERENEKEKAEIVVDSVSGEVRATWNSDAAGEAGTVSNDVAKSDPINGNHELGGNVEDIGVPRAENSGQIEGDISNIGGVDKAVTTPEDAIDSHGNGGVRSSRKDELRYVGSVVDGECEGRRGRPVGRSGRKRVLPPSLKGKEKEVGEKMSGLSLEEKEKEKKSGLLDLLDILKSVFGDMDGGCDSEEEDVDFLETAKSRGMTFPRPRWWPSEGDEEEGFSS